MGKVWVGSLVAAVTLAIGIARAEAQQSKVKLTVEKPVYKLGSGAVKFTLKNEGTSTVFLGTPSPWSISNGNQSVFFPISIQVIGSLPPGQSKSWAWNMRNQSGQLVSKGSYTVKVGSLWYGNTEGSAFQLYKTFALTPSGKLAGFSRFPLAVGNEWNYTGGFADQSMKVTQANPASPGALWYKVTNLVGQTRWAFLNQSSKPTLFATANLQTTPLFRFNRPVGTVYATKMETFTKLKVGAVNETVVTPVGKFTGCYRLDVAATTIADGGYGSFWFAPGVGLVQYSTPWFGGSHVYRLASAKIKGSDGTVYTISHK